MHCLAICLKLYALIHSHPGDFWSHQIWYLYCDTDSLISPYSQVKVCTNKISLFKFQLTLSCRKESCKHSTISPGRLEIGRFRWRSLSASCAPWLWAAYQTPPYPGPTRLTWRRYHGVSWASDAVAIWQLRPIHAAKITMDGTWVENFSWIF